MMMTIQRPALVVSIEAMQHATNELQKLWNELVATFGGQKMLEWTLVFNVPETARYSGLCDPTPKTVFISTVCICRDIQDGRNLDARKGTLIHEFCHGWCYEYQPLNWLHHFGFHVLVSLLLAKYNLSWDKTLYNLCDDQKGTYNYTPKKLFRLCRYAAPHIKSQEDLQSVSVRIRERFNTQPHKLIEWKTDSMNPKNLYKFYKFLFEVEKENYAEALKKARLFERSFYSLLAVVGVAIVLQFS